FATSGGFLSNPGKVPGVRQLREKRRDSSALEWPEREIRPASACKPGYEYEIVAACSLCCNRSFVSMRRPTSQNLIVAVKRHDAESAAAVLSPDRAVPRRPTSIWVDHRRMGLHCRN